MSDTEYQNQDKEPQTRRRSLTAKQQAELEEEKRRAAFYGTPTPEKESSRAQLRAANEAMYDWWKYDRNNLAYTDETEITPETGEWSDFGNSRHDADVVAAPTYGQGELNEMRAADQGFWEKVGLGATKMTTTAATTFLDNTVGFLWGGISALRNGDASKIYDNDFTNAMADFNEWCEEQMPHYSSKYEGWGADFWGNFIGKDILQNAGFQIGTGLSMIVPGAMLKVPGQAFKATKMFSNFMKTGRAINTGNAAKDLVISTYAAVGEASIEALDNKRNFVKYQKQVADDEFKAKNAELDMQWKQLVATKYGGDEDAARSSMDFNDYWNKQNELKRMRSDKEKFIQKEAEKVGDMTFLANLALVGGTNFSTFGKAFTGYNLNKRFGDIAQDIVDAEGNVLKKNVWNSTAKDVIKSGKYKVKNENYGKWVRNSETGKLEKDTREYIEKAAKVEARAKEKSVGFNIAKDMFFEGLEEMNQETAAQYSAGIAEAEMLQYEALANSGMAYDDILKQMNNTWFSYGEMTKALGKVYTDPQQYRQFFGGALGMVFSPHFTKKPGGGLQFHLNNIGAQSAAIREQNSTNAYIAEQINKTLNSDESKNYLTGLLRHSALERVKQGAVASDNRMDYEDADFAQFVSDITMMGNAGKLDLLQARLEGMRNMSDDEMEKVCMQLAEQVDKKGKSEVIGDFVDNNGNYLGNTDADKLKIREKINKRIDRLQKDISLYQKTMNDIDGATGGKLDHQTLATFTWEKAQVMNKYARAKDIIGSKAKDSIGVYRKHLSSKLLTLNTNLKLSESSLKQEKESLAKKKTADGKPIEPSELQKNLEKQIENYTKQITAATQVDSLLNDMEKLQSVTDDHKSDKDVVTALFEQYKSFKDKMPDVFTAMKWRDKDGKVIEDNEQKPKDFSLEQLLVTGQFDNFMSVMTGTDQADKVKDLKDAAKLYQHAKAAEESLEKLLENPLQFTDQRTKFEEEVATFTNKDLIKSLKKELSKGIDAGDITLQNLQEKAEELAKAVIESRREGIKGKITSVLESGTNVELIKKKAIEGILNDKKYKDLRDLMDFINQVNFRIAVNQKASQEAKQVALETFNRIVKGKKNVEEITETKLELKDFDTNSLLVEESNEIKQQKLNALKGGMPNLTFDLNNYQFTEESKTNAAIARNEAKELLESVIEEADNAINKPQLRENQEKDNEFEQIKKEREILDKRYDGVLKSIAGLIENYKKGEVPEENDITELIEQMQKIADDKFNPKDFHESLSKLVDSKRQQLYGDIWRFVDGEIKQRKYHELEKDFTEEEKGNNKVVKQAFAEINKTLSKVQKALEKSDDRLVTLGIFDSIAVEDGSYELRNSVEGCYFYDGQVYRGNMVKVSVPNQQGEFYAVAFKTGVDKFDWFLIDSNGAVVNDNLQTDYAMFPTTRQGINSIITFGDVELTSPNALSLQLFKELQPLEIPTAGDAKSVRLQNKKCEFCRQLLIDNGVLDENGKVKTKGNLAQSVVAANVIMNDSLTSSATEAEQVTETIEGNIKNNDRQYRVFFDNERDELVRVILIGKTIHYKDENGKTWTRNIKKELKKKNDDGSRKTIDDVLRELHGQDIEIVNSSKEDWDSDIDINKQEQNVQQPQNEQGSQTVTEQKPTEIPQQRKVVENKKNILRIKRTINQLDEQIAELDSMLKRLQDAAKQNPQYHDTVRTVTTFKQYVEFVHNNYKALEEPKNIVLDENQVFSMMDSFRQQLGKIFDNDVQFLSDEEMEQAAKDAQAQFSKKYTDLQNNSENLTFSNIDKAIKTSEWNQEALDELNNLITDIENGTKIFRRYDSSLLGQQQERFRRGGRVYESASVILGRNSENGKQRLENQSRKKRESPLKRLQRRQREGKDQERIIEAWAKANDLWLNDYTDEQGNKANSLEDLMESQWEHLKDDDGNIIDGSESTVYIYDKHTYIKAINLSHYHGSLQRALDKIIGQNALQANAGLELVGFGRDSMGNFCMIALQPKIQGEELTDDDYEDFKNRQNLKADEDGYYTLGSIRVSDLGKSNLRKFKNPTTNKTEYFIIDADYELSQEESEIDNSITSAQSEPIQFHIGKKARTEFENKLRKARPDMSDSEIKATLDFLHELADNKENNAFVKAAVTWVANKSITLPEDYEKVRQVFDVARKKNIDVQKYKTFGELMSAPEMQKKEKEKKAFNPDEAKTFSNKRTVRVSSRREFVVYDVENTEEGQQDVVSAIAAHYESSPWCLATFTNTGKPTESAKTYWNKYNGIPRKIAFENGRPVAFCSAEQKFTFNGYNVVKDVNGKYFVDDILSDNEISKLVNIDDYLTGETDEEGYELSEKGIKEVKQVENQEDAWWDLNDEYPQEKLGTWVATKRTRKEDPDGWIHEDNFTEALLDDLENSEREAREEQEDWDLNHFDINDIPFSKSNGEIYGFTNEGKIILNKDKFRLDTPVHEYTHLWDKACIEHSPELWKRGVELMKQTDEWQRVIEDNNYTNIKDNEDLVASEVHSRLSGMLAAGKAISFAGNKRIKKGFWAKLIEWFRQFKDFTLRRVFGMSKEDAQKVTLEQFLSAPVADFMLGTDPRKINKNAYIQSKTKSTQRKTKKHDFNIGDTVQYGPVVDEKFTPITNDANIVAINGDDITIEYDGKKVKTKSKYLRFLYGAKPSSQYSGNEKNVKIIEQKLGKKELSAEEAFARFIANSDITINEQEAKNVRDVNKKLVSSDGLTYDSIASLFKQNNEAFATIDDEEIRTWISEMFANEDGRFGIEKYAAQLHYDPLDRNWEAEVNRIQQALNNETNKEADNEEEPDYVFSDEEYNKYLSQVADEIANEEADRQLYDEVMIQEIESITNSSFDLLSDDEKQEYIKGYEEYQEQRIKEETNQTFEEYWQDRLNGLGNEPINDDAELADFYEPIYDKVNRLKNEEVPPTQLNIINDNSEQDIKNQINKTAKSERNDIELDTFKPSISEFGISNHREHALTEIANSPKERKKIAEGKRPGDYRYIYSLYQATGAFDYVKQGKLKAGQEVFIGYGKVGQAGGNTFNNVVFFVKDENGEYQMIGTLSDMAERDPNSAKKLHYFFENEYNNKSNFERITITAKSTNDYFKANQPIHFDLYKPNGNYLTTNVSKILNGSLLFSESRHSLKDVKLPNNKTIEQAIDDGDKTDIAIAFYTSDLQLTGNANFTATADELKKMKAFKNVRSEVSGHIVLAIDKPDGRKQLIPLRVATVAEIINKPKNFVADKINEVIDQIYEVYSTKSNDLNGKNRNLIVLINKLQTLVHEPTQAGIHIYANPNKAIKIQVGMYDSVTLKNDDKTFVSKDEFRKELLRQLNDCFININEDVMNDETRINSYINSDVFSTELEETSYRNAFFTVNPIDEHGNKLNKKKDIKDNLILKRKDVSEIVCTIGKKGNQDIVVVRTKKGEYKVMLMYNDVLNNVSISEYSTEQQLRMIDYAKLKAGQKSDKDTLINEAYIETTDKTVGPQDVILHTTEYGSKWYYDPTNFSTTTGNIYTLDSDGNKKYIYKTPDFDDINNDEQQTFDDITIKEGKQKGEQGEEPQSQSSELPNYVKDKETITTLLSINNIESFVRFFNKFSNDEMFDIVHGKKKLFGIDRTNYESYLNKIGEDFLIKTCNFLYKYDADVLSELHSKFEDEIDMGSEFEDIINDSKNEIMSILENHRKKDIEEKNSCNFGI